MRNDVFGKGEDGVLAYCAILFCCAIESFELTHRHIKCIDKALDLCFEVMLEFFGVLPLNRTT